MRNPLGFPTAATNAPSAHGWIRELLLLLVLICPCSALFGADISLQWDANTESNLAGYKVYYGTSSRNYGSPIDVGNVTTYTVRNLGPGTYFFAVTAYDTTGSESGYSNEVSTMVADTTPPVISSVAAGSITSSAATITWTTNESSDSQVEYGTTPGFGSSTSLNATLVTAHSQALGGLVPGTLYYFRVKSRDAAGNLTVSGSFNFTTAALPCSFSASPTLQTFGTGSGSGTVSVTASAGCAWTATSNAAWVTITAGASGSGNGTVSYAVAVNSTGNPRTGTMTVAGQTVTISQQGTSCDMNRDGAVNAVDLQLLVNVILGITTCPGSCDTNHDGKVDALDLQILVNVVLGMRSCP